MTTYPIPLADPAGAGTETPPADTTTAPDPDRLLTVEGLRARRGVSRKTLTVWTQRGRVPCLRLGARVLYRWSDVLAALRRPPEPGQRRPRRARRSRPAKPPQAEEGR